MSSFTTKWSKHIYIYIQIYIYTIFIAYKAFRHFYIKIFNKKRLNINRIRDYPLSEKVTMLYEGEAMLMWQHPVVLYETLIVWLYQFLQEKSPEEENNKNYEVEEEIKKWNHMEVNHALLKSKYESHEIKIKYKDETIKLIPVLEEMAIFLERVIDIDYSKKRWQ